MHSTPVNENDEAGYSPIHAIYLISHGTENRSVRITGAEAVSRVMANCIHQAWGREIISGLLESVSTMCSNVPVYKLSFLPDLKIIDEILNNGK
jgi:hypothetical protein